MGRRFNFEHTETVINGGFWSWDNWANRAGWNLINGRARWPGLIATNQTLVQALGIGAGFDYDCSFDLWFPFDVRLVTFHLGNVNKTFSNPSEAGIIHHEFRLTPAAGNTVRFSIAEAFGDEAEVHIDNVSVNGPLVGDDNYNFLYDHGFTFAPDVMYEGIDLGGGESWKRYAARFDRSRILIKVEP